MQILVSWIEGATGAEVEMTMFTEASARELAVSASIGADAMIEFRDEYTLTNVKYEDGVEVYSESGPLWRDVGEDLKVSFDPEGGMTLNHGDGRITVLTGTERNRLCQILNQ